MSKYIRIETNDGRVYNFPVDQTTEQAWIDEYHRNQADWNLTHKAPKITKFLTKLHGQKGR